MYAGHFDFTVPLVGSIPALWPRARCDARLAALDGATWLPATVNAAAGRVVDPRLRDNDTAILDDAAVASVLFAEVAPHLPATMTVEWDGGGRRSVGACGLFTPLRVYRYQPGQRFGLHHDQSYRRDDGARSLLTLLIYLDDDCDGGETDFPEQDLRFTPRAGDAVWFQHPVLHAGLPVTRGVKHVLRSDVLFAP